MSIPPPFLTVIDGPVASGKSTVAKIVSQRLDLFHLNLGAIHRSNAWALQTQRIDLGDEPTVLRHMTKIEIRIDYHEGDYRYLVNEIDRTHEIFLPDIGELASRLVLFGGVETRIHNLARQIIQSKRRVIADGRGMYSIFPAANIRLFLTASFDARVSRYSAFLRQQGIYSDPGSLAKQIQTRDHRDETRPKHPLRIADDAVVIDSTNLTVSEVVDKVVYLITYFPLP
jgi:cytidylate kinase